MGGGPCAEAVDYGTDMGNSRVGGLPHAGAGEGAMMGLGLGAAGWYYGDESGYQGKGGV